MSTERILNGRYRMEELIGRGGMADVYRGTDLRLQRTVAVKMMRPDLARDPQFQSRFRREATRSAALNHPNIVHVFDTGEEEVEDRKAHEVSCPFLVMEYVSGGTMKDAIAAGDVTVEEAVAWLDGLLAALAYSHRRGIVHRDVKPANVMVTGTGEVKVMDFGIARALADSAATMTQTQTVVGTARYLSPEQAMGGEVGIAADLYAVGCVAFELLTGRPPFVGESPVSVAYQHVRQQPLRPSSLNPEVSPALDAVVLTALAKDPQDRFDDADAFATALAEALDSPQTVPDTAALPVAAGATQTAVSPAAAASVDAGRPLPPRQDPSPAVPAATAAAGTAATGATASGATGSSDRERPRRRGVLGWLVAVAVLVVAAAVALPLLLTDRPAQVEVPEVAGLPAQQAEAALADAGLRPRTTEVFDDHAPSGEALGTDPAAGTPVEAGSTVQLRVSQGPAAVTLPESLRGASEATVREELSRLGLSVAAVSSVDSGDVPRDRLVSTRPALGSTVPAGSTVDLELSTGRVAAPNLVGLTEAAARDALREAAPGLQVRVQQLESFAAAPGTVLRQDPPAGRPVDNQSVVTLTVAREVPAEPSPTPSESASAVPRPTPAPSSATPSAPRGSATPSGSSEPSPSPSGSAPSTPTPPSPSAEPSQDPEPSPSPSSGTPSASGSPSETPSNGPAPRD